VYANLLEHILLHIMIGEQNKGLGFGGAEIMIAQANDFYADFGEKESVLSDGFEVLELLKERCGNSIAAYETLFEHNQTVFYELEDTLAKADRALVVIGTGLGKTTTALAYLRKYGIRGIVLGPNRIITDDWAKNKEVDVYTYQWFMNNYKTIDFSKYGVLICDEAHHCAAPKWGEGIRYVLDNGLIKVMGLTATPKEQKDKKNYETSSQFFKGCVCQGFTVLDGIERGIIHDFSYVGAIYDTSGIREKYSDLSDEKLKGELDLALNNTPTMEEIFRKHLPQSKRKGIVFCTDIKAIDEAEVIMRKVLPNAEFRRMHSLMGVEAEKARKWFEGADEGWLFAVNMISEGAHYKGVNTIVMFRRTESSLVFNQQLGRIITLVRDEDPEAIVFDLVNNANNIQGSGKRFAGSLRAAYQKRKENGGKKKSEQVIVEDYAEKISEILQKCLNNGQKRAVICIETGVVYPGINEASRQTGIEAMNIGSVCRKKRITAGKYHWAYADDSDTIKELSIFHGAGPAKKIAPGKYKKVICIETGVIYESCQHADEAIGGSKGKVSAVCCGSQDTTGGYHWCFLDDEQRIKSLQHFVGKEKTKAGLPRCIYCVETGEFFTSIREAKSAKNCNNIEKCLSGERATAGGYHWCYAEDRENFVMPTKKRNSLYKMVRCIETNIIYDTAAEAQRMTGVNSSSIGDVCRGKRKTAGGYHWEYVEEDA
jgi:superfamily II DNA or RNA helicase